MSIVEHKSGMEGTKIDTQDDDTEYYDAPVDFMFYDCEEDFPDDPIQSSSGASSSFSYTESVLEDRAVPMTSLRRRRSFKVPCGDSKGFESSLNSKNLFSPQEKDEKYSDEMLKSEKILVECENSDPLVCNQVLQDKINSVHGSHVECSGLTHVDIDSGNGIVEYDEFNLREDYEADSGFLFTLAGLMVKIISFQIDMLVRVILFPGRLVYNLCLIVVDPFWVVRHAREYLIKKMEGLCSIGFTSVSSSVYECLKEHNAIWKFGLKCGWGLVWSTYVCSVLVMLLVLAFAVGGFLVRGLVDEPVRMKKNLNFDYTEKSPVAFVPLIAEAGMSPNIYLGEEPETRLGGGSRVIPPKHKLQITVSLTLPESVYNHNLGIFQVRVDFLSANGKSLATSRRPCMLHYRSRPIRLLLTFLKLAPILTGYSSETQTLKIHFRGFIEGELPTACLRVVMEQRAEYLPGTGIPEIYDAVLTLDSEQPLLKKFLWLWKKTLFVWLSIGIFILELVFALICCKPIIIPKIRLRQTTDIDAQHNGTLARN